MFRTHSLPAKTNEATLMSIGMCVSSINKDQHSGGQSKRGLRDIAKQIDNSQDLKTYVLNHAAKIGPRRTSLRYERHPVSMRRFLRFRYSSLLVASCRSTAACSSAAAATAAAPGAAGLYSQPPSAAVFGPIPSVSTTS